MKLGWEASSANADLLKAEKQLNALNRELAWELSKAAADVAGLVDPTPISDAVSMGMSLIDGDTVGASLSLISMVPFAGDALAKTTKGARATQKILKLRKKIQALATKVRALKAAKTAKPGRQATKTINKVNKATKNISTEVCIPCQKKVKTGAKKTGLKAIKPSKSKLAARRRAAVNQAWKQERDMVARTGRGTRQWTRAEKQELLRTGKVKGYEGHHINNVDTHPQLAGDADNIEFVRGRAEHLQRHGGNWRRPTKGKLLKRR